MDAVYPRNLESFARCFPAIMTFFSSLLGMRVIAHNPSVMVRLAPVQPAAYRIEINIGATALLQISAAQQAVTIVRGMRQIVEAASAVCADAPVLAWQVFQPRENNLVAWTDRFRGYATGDAAQIGAVVAAESTTEGAMQPGFCYQFNNGAFTAQQVGGTGLQLSNASTSNTLAFGLAQQTATPGPPGRFIPISAQIILHGQTAYLFPQQYIHVFLSSCTVPGTVIPAPGHALTLPMNGTGQTWRVEFNPATNQFYQSP